MRRALILAAVLLVGSVAYGQDKVVDRLQASSVTIRTSRAQGSGTIVTRKRGEETISFVLTAAHVIDDLRKTRELIDPASGSKRMVIEFSDAAIVQEYRQFGRRIGESKMDAQVLRYSDSENGEDLAILRVRKLSFAPVESSGRFYLESEIPPIGTKLYHVGSLLGQFGSNSLTSGVMSQQGRVIEKLGANGVVFDQVTCVSFPGSSGGGVYLESDGRYVGMLVRGAGEGFGLVVPVRRILAWAKRSGVEWAVDGSVPVPSDDELARLAIDDSGVTFGAKSEATKAFPYLIRTVGE